MIGCVIHRFSELGSTNDEARRLADEGAVEGTVVIASHQTKGRGSRGRAWLSPPDVNLLFSVVLRPNLPAHRLGELAFVTAVGAAGGLRKMFALDVRVKWPNDIVVGSRKIGGIVIEAGANCAIVGIGVNVNWVDLPGELAESATSIAIETGGAVDIEKTFRGVLAGLESAYADYLAYGFGKILDEWRSLACGFGEDVELEIDGRVLQGRVVGVEDDGSLLIETCSGEKERVSSVGCVLAWRG